MFSSFPGHDTFPRDSYWHSVKLDSRPVHVIPLMIMFWWWPPKYELCNQKSKSISRKVLLFLCMHIHNLWKKFLEKKIHREFIYHNSYFFKSLYHTMEMIYFLNETSLSRSKHFIESEQNILNLYKVRRCTTSTRRCFKRMLDEIYTLIGYSPTVCRIMGLIHQIFNSWVNLRIL